MAFRRLTLVGYLVLGAALIPLAAQYRRPALEGPSDSTSGTVSTGLLRYHVSPKAMRSLQEARRTADSGDHAGAIKRLQSTLAKYPDAAAWVQPMLGVEYLKVSQLGAALSALEQAVLLLPKDAITRSNLGLCLALMGHYDRAEEELRHALLLSGHNTTTEELLQTLRSSRRGQLAATSPLNSARQDPSPE